MKPPAVLRILFVCMGNICRSPAAEGVLRAGIQRAGLTDRVEIDSAGTIGLHAGEPADRRMRAAAQRRGYDLDGRARALVAADLERFDLILTMDEDNRRGVLAHTRAADQSARVCAFVDFCRRHPDREVPDPYYGGEAGFEHVLDLLEDGCEQIVEWARRRLAGEGES